MRAPFQSFIFMCLLGGMAISLVLKSRSPQEEDWNWSLPAGDGNVFMSAVCGVTDTP